MCSIHSVFTQPHFLYWYQTLELQLTALELVKALRTADFKLYCEVLLQLMPWVFALDHIHYARNLPVHLRDMLALEELHPAIHKEFIAGRFVGQKTNNAFSSIALDQMHEQLICTVKGDGGAIGLTEDPALLHKHMVVGPELSRIIQEFECKASVCNGKHHEQYSKFQKVFKEDVEWLITAFEDLGNPFLEDSGDLVSLGSSCIMPKEVVETVKTIKDVGEKQFRNFITDRIETQSVPWTSTIHLNKLPLFAYKPKPSKQKSNFLALKNERTQVIHMMLSSQSGREINENVFSHENSSYPPSLSRNEEIYCSTKSEIIKCLEYEIAPSSSTKPPADVIILDGAFIVQMLKPSNATTFQEYADNIFIPHVMSWLASASRIDIVWDRYTSDSLKNATRSK